MSNGCWWGLNRSDLLKTHVYVRVILKWAIKENKGVDWIQVACF